jgi:hypothetical protein
LGKTFRLFDDDNVMFLISYIQKHGPLSILTKE